MHSALELRFPHIVRRLTETWRNDAEASRYLEALLFTSRQRPERHGFDEEAWAELVFLDGLLKTRNPAPPSPLGTDVWAIAWDTQPRRPTS
jgi:hypothetical protein